MYEIFHMVHRRLTDIAISHRFVDSFVHVRPCFLRGGHELWLYRKPFRLAPFVCTFLEYFIFSYIISLGISEPKTTENE